MPIEYIPPPYDPATARMTFEQHDRYHRAMHSMQSATALQIGSLGEKDAAADPKHLRVGINSAMADHGALVELLIELGIFSQAEYLEAVVKGAEREAESVAEYTRRKLRLPSNTTFA